ncbi:3829_t:CDS:1, partial [Dentiscutata heterogama]
NASIKAFQNRLIQYYTIIRKNQPIEADQQSVSNHFKVSNQSHTSSSRCLFGLGQLIFISISLTI